MAAGAGADASPGTGVGTAFFAAAAFERGFPQSIQNRAPGSLARPQYEQVVTGDASPRRGQKLWYANLLRNLARRKGSA